MKLLMTADAIGGVWTYTLELCGALAPQGVQVVLATMGAPLSTAQRADLRQLRNAQLCESTFQLEWMDNPWSEVDRAGEWLLRLADEYQVDVVHLNGYSHGALPWRTRPLVVGHSCVSSWWRAVKREEPPAALTEYRRRVRAGVQAAGCVVAPSAAMLASLERDYGPLTAGCRVIPNGRNAALFRDVAAEPMIVSIGRVWDEAKNIGALQRIGGQVEWPIFIIGSPMMNDESANASRQSPVTSQQSPVAAPSNRHATLLGMMPQQDVAAILSRAAIYALPAKYEPFGFSVLEAALSGCALVLGDVPALRENWDGAAFFVDPYDDDALERGLHSIIRDERARSELAQRALQRARHFTPQQMATRYLNLYVDVMAAPAAARGAPCA